MSNKNQYEYWCINDEEIPEWVQDLIDRKLLKHEPTYITDCYIFKQTEMTTSPIYLYDGDGLMLSQNKIGIVFHYYRDFNRLKMGVPVRKIFCDICGEEIYSEQNIYIFKLYKQDDYIQNTKEICQRCSNKIKEIIKSNKS